MKRLRKSQKRVDTMRTEVRPRRRGRVGRYVYLAMLGGFALLLFDLLAGDLVYLRSDGMVAQNIAIVGPEYAGTTLSVAVEPGELVEQNQTIAVLRSQKMLKDIADLAAQIASAEARLSEFRIRRRQLASLIPQAQKRVDSTGERADKIESLRGSGLVTLQGVSSAEANAYKALEELKELQATAEIIGAEYVKFEKVARRAERALREIEALYNNGELRATETGLIGNVLVAPGEGVAEGQRMMEIYHGPPYVLAYVPVGALYNVVPGDDVVIRFGFETLSGQIEALQPLAYRLPQEFQRQFRTAERKQLVRVRLSGNLAPPLFTEVEVTWPGSVRALMADAANFAVDGLRLARGGIGDLWGRRAELVERDARSAGNLAAEPSTAIERVDRSPVPQLDPTIAATVSVGSDAVQGPAEPVEHAPADPVDGLAPLFGDAETAAVVATDITPPIVDAMPLPGPPADAPLPDATLPLPQAEPPPETAAARPVSKPTPNSTEHEPEPAKQNTWRIQLVSLGSRLDAETVWARLRQVNPDLLNPLSLHLQSAELPDGIFYGVQAGPLADRARADALCDSLKSRNQDCFIVSP